MRAYVLIQTERAGEPVAHKLETIPGILSAEDLTGAYDAIATDSSRHLMDVVIDEIRGLPGVTRALPAPWIGSFERSGAGSPKPDPGSA